MLRSATVPLATALLLAAAAVPASALTMKECSTKYQAAKQAGTLGAQKWGDFRRAECGDTAAAAPASGTKTSVPNPLQPGATRPAAPAPTAARPAPAAPSAPGSAAFPAAVSAKYASESAGKARMHTCLDQYNANKAAGGNGGLNWIAKGGGYYSECNKRLKS